MPEQSRHPIFSKLFQRRPAPGPSTFLALAKNLTFAYGANKVLEAVDLQLERGQVYGLCGENGSGKTTLAKILTGQLGGYSGLVKAPKKRYSILVPQQLRWFSSLKLRDYLLAAGLDPRALLAEPANLKLPSPSTPVRDVDPQSLAWISSLAAVDGGRVLAVFDETSSYFSTANRKSFWKLVRDFADRGGSVVCIGHRLDELFENCDAIFALKNNSVSRYRPSDLDSSELTRQLFDSAVYSTGFGGAGLSPAQTETRKLNLAGLELAPGQYHAVLGLRDQGLAEFERRLVSAGGGGLSPIQLNGFGYVPSLRQRDALFPGLTVFENLAFHHRNELLGQRIWKREIPADPRPLMKSAVMERPAAAVDTLSSGMAQLLVIRRELQRADRGILAADPGQGLDHKKRFELSEEFAILAGAGKIVLVLSQELDEVAARAQSWSIARRGSLSRIFTLAALGSALSEDDIRILLGAALAGSDESLQKLNTVMDAYEAGKR